MNMDDEELRRDREFGHQLGLWPQPTDIESETERTLDVTADNSSTALAPLAPVKAKAYAKRPDPELLPFVKELRKEKRFAPVAIKV